jgi:hypothetical protein
MVAQQLLCQPAAAAGGLLLLELVDEIDEIEEPPSGAGADDRGSDGDAQMGLPGAGAADEDAVARDTENVRTISLIGRRCSKYARRI